MLVIVQVMTAALTIRNSLMKGILNIIERLLNMMYKGHKFTCFVPYNKLYCTCESPIYASLTGIYRFTMPQHSTCTDHDNLDPVMNNETTRDTGDLQLASMQRDNYDLHTICHR